MKTIVAEITRTIKDSDVAEIIKTIKDSDTVIERDMAMRHFRNWQQGANGMSTSGMYIMHTAR